MSLTKKYRPAVLTHNSSKPTNALGMLQEIQPWEFPLSAWEMAQKGSEMI
jgi:hypothetical protein